MEDAVAALTPVREFHIAADQLVADHPTVPDAQTIRLRIRLIKEEYLEVMEHLEWLLHHREASLSEALERLSALLGELCDLRYVLEGTAVSMGLPIDAAYADVHRANMSKRWPGEALMRKDPGGKVLKGPDFAPADLARYIIPVEGEIVSTEKYFAHKGLTHKHVACMEVEESRDPEVRIDKMTRYAENIPCDRCGLVLAQTPDP